MANVNIINKGQLKQDVKIRERGQQIRNSCKTINPKGGDAISNPHPPPVSDSRERYF